ncbi:hypothetical protein BOX15_Mlig017946g1 [Macrostomum lignano]|uniref:ABC transporter domain-containing protein n=1 Tax=Macrostomum lignano TaxID=282301 RepID=A0A267FAI4_9PLAT|nr:hypothetical protein BOX15_Mlig017946g1 [Macrostomum lignano]
MTTKPEVGSTSVQTPEHEARNKNTAQKLTAQERTQSRTIYLIKLLLRLKKIKFLWMVIVLVSAFSNYFIFPIVDSWMGNLAQTLSKIDAAEFYWSSLVMLQVHKYSLNFVQLMEMIKESQGSYSAAGKLIRMCNGTESCKKSLFYALYGLYNTSLYTAYVDFAEPDAIPSITCQLAYGADLHCPFFGHVVSVTKSPVLYHGGNRFKEVNFFSLVTHSQRTLRSDSSSMCGRHTRFDLVFSRTIMLQTILVIVSTMFYFVVGTISCIVELKRNGFLAIMFHKGLPIRSYWAAVWSVTGVEVLLISFLLSLSIFLQCPGYYSISSMLLAFVAVFFQLSGMAALSLLLTVLEKSLFHISLTMTLIALCSCSFVLILRLLLHNVTVLKVAFLFIMPLSHVGEFLQAVLLSVILPDSVTAYHYLIVLFLIVFTIATIALTLYLDFILPSGNGMCLPYGYVTDRRFWTAGQREPSQSAVEDPLAGEELPDTPNFEPMTDGFNPIIRISQLCRVYSKKFCQKTDKEDVIALSNVSAHIYEGQITAIIGHNGSGKTTLLNILNGTDQSTSGRVSVNGLLMENWVNRLRLNRIIGICPQENSLCSSLTVGQTIELAQLSCGHSPETWEEEASRLFKALRLSSHRGSKVAELSSGFSRKLCTAVALIGDAKVLFLDEPTNGVDPVSRRLIWRLLQECKTKCSIILSTQAMDEADTLADRKIFLSGGSVLCAGSSLFLKSAFDCGFDFNVTLKQPSYVPLLIKQIQQEFAKVKVKNRLSTSLVFHLPATEINSLFVLAQSLERRSNWITAFGLLQASLYDIFMRLRDLRPSEVEKLFKEGRIGLVSADEEPDELEDQSSKPSQSRLAEMFTEMEKKICPSFLMRFRAIAYLNVLRVVRSRIRLATRIISPAVLLVLLLILAVVERGANNSKMVLRNNLTNFGEAFSKGICLYREGDLVGDINASWCSVILRSHRLKVRGENFVKMQIPDGAQFYEYIQEPAQLDRIKAACNSPEDLVGCPIVFTDTWDASQLNSARKLYVGSFSTFEQHNSFRDASVSMGAYTKFSRFIMAKKLGQEHPVSENAYKVMALTAYNFRSTFIPLYGAFVQLIIIAIVPATFLDDLMEDRDTKIKNQLSSMGVEDVQYWIIMFLVHWIQYAIIYLSSVVLIVVINFIGYGNSFYLVGVVLPTLVLGLSNNQLLVYILSSLLNKSNPVVSVMHLFFSIFLVFIILAAQLDNVFGIVLISVLPPFTAIALTFYGTKAIFYTLSYFELKRISEVKGGIRLVYFSQPHVLSSLIALAVHSVLLAVLMVFLDERATISQKIHSLIGSAEADFNKDSDSIGLKEETRSLTKERRNPDNMLEIRHLSAAYQSGNNVVSDVTLSTSPGEIFGLLGPNGAGKSTTLSVIVGDLRAKEGCCEVQVVNQWMASRLAARRGRIGYCPQYNPQYSDVTVREHLEFYASIIGAKESKDVIDVLLQCLCLTEHEKKTSKQLSYGFKRRLSLAAILLGNPCLLVIDEASTGVDPEGKRILWKAIQSLASRRNSIVVTTHSMEEAEALCHRVGVLNHGLLVGLGSVQELKSRFGLFYTLEVLVRTDRGNSAAVVATKRAVIVDAVSKKFPNTAVIEEFANRVIFSIPMFSIVRLSLALMWLAETRAAIGILYFSFYQMSLDQVFSRMILLHNRQLFGNADGSLSSIDDESVEQDDG